MKPAPRAQAACLLLLAALLLAPPAAAATAVPGKAARTAKSAAGLGGKAPARKPRPGAAARKPAAAAKPPKPAFPALDSIEALQREVAAARAIVEAEPKNGPARERLANAGVVAAEFLLAAEALGNSARVEELLAFLNARLHDVGWRLGVWAKAGDLRATQALGVLQANGAVLALDRGKACEEFQKAAGELAASAWRRAQCVIESSPDEAWVLMERAALLGHAAAQEWVARRCLGEFGAAGRDFSCAREWLQRSAAQGRARSQSLLGYLLNAGHGGAVDAAGALRLYRLAAGQGDADAQNNLGEIHESGRGLARDPAEALRWYLRAAEQGLAAAQFNAGRMLAVGAAGPADPAHARRWLVRAEAGGVAQARKVLDWLDGGSLGLEAAVPPAGEAAPTDRGGPAR